jgi:hypothetical protein
MKAGIAHNLRDFQIFRTFDWMLSDVMRDKASTWIQMTLQFDLKCPSKAIADKASGSSDAVIASSSSSCTSSSQLARPSLLSAPSMKQVQPGASSKKQPHSGAVNVVSFFAAKPK